MVTKDWWNLNITDICHLEDFIIYINLLNSRRLENSAELKLSPVKSFPVPFTYLGCDSNLKKSAYNKNIMHDWHCFDSGIHKWQI